MNKLMIVIGMAIAIASNAVADSAPSATRWYDGGITNNWPNSSTMKGCYWNWNEDYSDAQYKDGYVEVDGDLHSNVCCTARTKVDLNNGKVEQTVKMIPYVETNSLQYPDDAKTALCVFAYSNTITGVVTSNYYGFVKDTTTNNWAKLSGAEYHGGEVTLNMTIRYETSNEKGFVTFNVSEDGNNPTNLTYLGAEEIEIVVNETKMHGMQFVGDGKIRDVSALKYVKGSSIVPGLLFNK